MPNISTLVKILNECQASALLAPKRWKWSETVKFKKGENLYFPARLHYTNIRQIENEHSCQILKHVQV